MMLINMLQMQMLCLTLFAILVSKVSCTTMYTDESGNTMEINDEPAEGGSIDEMIVNAANSSREFEFFYDDNHRFLKVEYDIVLSFDEYEAMKEANRNESSESSTGRKKRTVGLKAGNWGARRWANNEVHFQFLPHFSGKDINTIHAAIDDWKRYTCVNFIQNNVAENRIQFKNGGGCYSRLGMVGGAQELGLAEGCRYKGIVIHEIGHALGLHHEQTRPDRDNYIRVIESNIAPGMRYNFEKQTWKTVMNLGIPYDYRSIMHYSKKAFSTNGRLTIRTLDQQYQDTIGNRQGLSFSDIKTVNIMYNCKKHQSGCTKTDDSCPGGGFVGKNCKCLCEGDSLSNPIKECSGGGGGRTPRPATQRPVTQRPVTQRPTTRRPVTSRPRTPRPPTPNSCQDQHRSCSHWASRGECNNNPGYMLLYCKRSCNRCSGGGNCRDTHAACSQWKSFGYCTHRYPEIVRPRCKKSCGLCGGGRDATNTATSKSKTTVSANCRDYNTQCVAWSRTGECRKNPAYMLQYCKKSCNQCGAASNTVYSNGNAAQTNRGSAYCRDANGLCAYWAGRGECYRNYAYMAGTCKRSCRLCT